MEQVSVFPFFKVASPLSSSPVLPVMSKGIGVLPQRARGAFVWTQTLLAQFVAMVIHQSELIQRHEKDATSYRRVRTSVVKRDATPLIPV